MAICTITGTVYDQAGAVAPSVRIRVTPVASNGVVTWSQARIVTSSALGVITITETQASIINFAGPVLGFNVATGVDLQIPSTSTANLSDLVAPVVAGIPVADSTSIVKGSVDGTKTLRFEVDGFTTATTRVATWPDKNGTVAMLSDIVDDEAATANYVFAGPATGAAAFPTMRALVTADIPSLSATYLPLSGGTLTGALLFTDNTLDIGASGATRPRSLFLGTNLTAGGVIIAGSTPTTLTDAAGKILSASLNTVGVAQGGTGLSSLGTALQQLRVNVGGTALEYFTPTSSVVGPASATDNAIARFNGTTGKLVQDSLITIDDSGNLAVDGIGGGTSAGARIFGYKSSTLTGFGSDYTARFDFEANPATDSNRVVYPLRLLGHLNGTVNYNKLEGIDIDVEGFGSGAVTGEIIAINSFSNNSSQASVAKIVGARFNVGSDSGTVPLMDGYQTAAVISAGTVTDRHGVYVSNPTGAGTLTNNYGLYIEDQTKGGTLNYSIYAAGGLAYFGGNVGIGTTTPGTNLVVYGASGGVEQRIQSGANYLRLYNDGAAHIGSSNIVYYDSGIHYFSGDIYASTALYGGNTASGNLTIDSTIDSTKGNVIIQPTGGNVGIGTTSPSAKLHVLGTTEQQRIGYDASNYYSTTVGSTGGVTFDAVGAGAEFTFNDDVLFNGVSVGSATFPALSTYTGNTTQYESVTQSAGLITHAALGSALNIGYSFVTKGTGQALFPTGATATPGIAFTAASTTGFRLAGSALVFTAFSADIWATSASNVVMRNNGFYGWSPTADPIAGTDLLLTRAAAANLQLGAADADTNALIVAQTIRSQGLLAGGTSNQAGKDWTFIASPSKGNQPGGSFVFQTVSPGATGTAINTPVTLLTINPTSVNVVGPSGTNPLMGLVAPSINTSGMWTAALGGSTNNIGFFSRVASDGGMSLSGISVTDQTALNLAGWIGSTAPTQYPVKLVGYKLGGGDLVSLAATEPVFGFYNNATLALSIRGDGLATFAGAVDTSQVQNASSIAISLGSNMRAYFDASNFRVAAANTIGFSTDSNPSNASTSAFSQISAGLIGVGTGAAGSFAGGLKAASYITGGANGETMTVQTASELLTLSTIGLTTDTTANLLPANSIILSVTVRVTTEITTTTDWAVGDPTTAARFSAANATLTAGTTSVGLNHMQGAVATDAAGPVQTAAAKVRITCSGANPGAGAVRICVTYISLVAPTS